MQLVIYIFLLVSEVNAYKNYMDFSKDIYIGAGEYISKRVLPNDWVVSVVDVGVMGYYCQCNVLDVGKLNDKYLAKNKLTSKQLAEYIYKHNPKFIAMTSRSYDNLTYSDQWDSDGVREGVIAVKDDPRFSEYKLIKKFWTDTRDQYQFIYERK